MSVALPDIPFSKRLTLNRYIHSLFGVESFEDLSINLRNMVYTGLSDDNLTAYHHTILQTIPIEDSLLTIEDLIRYDQNIISHTNQIKGNRFEGIDWKYFQYLALLFTEVYLDLYFNQRERFLDDLNAFSNQLNTRLPLKFQADPYVDDDLRRIVFWSATGSGKTLIMHANLKQILSALELSKSRKEFNKILLITPNEGLTKQHLQEFAVSNIRARIFSKKSFSLLSEPEVEILEITKLGEEEGYKTDSKTVSTESLGSNNLLFVDEGHRGATGNVWYARRNALAETGFTFEYSATIGQAVANDTDLDREYSKSIIFDYSYRYFYRDGFGKDYRIMNIGDEGLVNEKKSLYLTACLLAFHQQKLLYRDTSANSDKFNIENPLCVFVGSSVTKNTGNRDFSDIIEILLFLAEFTNLDNQKKFMAHLEAAISENTGLLNADGADAFAGMFTYLTDHMFTVNRIYNGMMEKIFNSGSNANAKIHVELISDAEGEISLRLGNNSPFGVINVGDAPSLFKKIEQFAVKNKLTNMFVFSKSNFSGSIFDAIGRKDSQANILIGSKKFTEGWNSWRVSTMGLLNVGKNEGTQVIQLFGRGVRLKGFDNSLMRHSELKIRGIQYNQYLRELETLNIFGIRSNYMERFKSFVEDEMENSKQEFEEIVLPVVNSFEDESLKIIRIKGDLDFAFDSAVESLTSGVLDKGQKVDIDFYTHIQSNISTGINASMQPAEKDEGYLTRDHLEFLDLDRIHSKLKKRKRDNGWCNLAIERECIRDIILDHSWYRVQIPSQFLSFDDFNNIKLWQKIAQTVVQKYSDRFYRKKRNSWESKHREYRSLTRDDPNFIEGYAISVPKSEAVIAKQLNNLKYEIENKNLPKIDQIFKSTRGGKSQAIFFDRHLYQPLLFSRDQELKIRQVVLNEGERQFVLDLKKYYESNMNFFENKNFHILRNLSIGRGVGFFEAGNFHPDFILWLLYEGKQYVSFVDPKGLVYQHSNKEKLRFHETIKEIQNNMENENIILNSFIISVTPFEILKNYYDISTKLDFASMNVFFQQDDNYISEIFNSMK